jgi:hypothetical protein
VLKRGRSRAAPNVKFFEGNQIGTSGEAHGRACGQLRELRLPEPVLGPS